MQRPFLSPNREICYNYITRVKLSMEDLLVNVKGIIRAECIVVVSESFMTDPVAEMGLVMSNMEQAKQLPCSRW